jgi:prepilin-type N-terminal cleavage/methylation domain-containing protein
MKKGFTIIEIVLALAVAGLIFLMVFLALPALQRAQRDKARRQDVSVVAGAIQQWRANNRGRNLQPETDLYQNTQGNDPNDTTQWQTAGNSKQLGPCLDANGDSNNPNQVLSSNSTLVGVYDGVATGAVYYQVGSVDKAGHISIFVGRKCPPDGYDHAADKVLMPKGAPNNYAIITVLATGGYFCQDV